MEKSAGLSATAQTKFQPTDYSHLLGMKGFSDKLLTTHFKLYQGYVSNTNILAEKMQELLKARKEDSPEFGEMKRRFGWEFNGMRLHEFYFDNLGGEGKLDADNPLKQVIDSNFGSLDFWKRDFIASGAMRGIGWVILYHDTKSNRLFNVWIEEHQANHFAGCQPLLVMDVFEHAYMTDYGTDRKAYIESFFKNIDWDAVLKRL